jgi:lipoprotein-anchoring transpeptidase ErfK/SrfK
MQYTYPLRLSRQQSPGGMHVMKFTEIARLIVIGSLLTGCGRVSAQPPLNSASSATPVAMANTTVQTAPSTSTSMHDTKSTISSKYPSQSLQSPETGQHDEFVVHQSYVNWMRPTGGVYPNLSRQKNIWVDVSISKQRLYIKAGVHTLYTMIISSGLDHEKNDGTPRGTFHIQSQRGTWFYAPRFKEGAKYWVSFFHHGQYLFHSVPMNAKGQVITSIAKQLGHEASHGCIHLSLPDSKWFYTHIQVGTKVIIHD